MENPRPNHCFITNSVSCKSIALVNDYFNFRFPLSILELWHCFSSKKTSLMTKIKNHNDIPSLFLISMTFHSIITECFWIMFCSYPLILLIWNSVTSNLLQIIITSTNKNLKALCLIFSAIFMSILTLFSISKLSFVQNIHRFCITLNARGLNYSEIDFGLLFSLPSKIEIGLSTDLTCSFNSNQLPMFLTAL